MIDSTMIARAMQKKKKRSRDIEKVKIIDAPGRRFFRAIGSRTCRFAFRAQAHAPAQARLFLFLEDRFLSAPVLDDLHKCAPFDFKLLAVDFDVEGEVPFERRFFCRHIGLG